MSDTRTVWVVSWVYWNGDEQGGGGFWWIPDRGTALEQFNREKDQWQGITARIRLVSIDVPVHLDGEALTRYIDHPDVLERIEVTDRSERVALLTGVSHG